MNDTTPFPEGAIAVGRRVRYIGYPEMSTWNRPCLGATARTVKSEIVTSNYTGNQHQMLVIEPEIKAKCFHSLMWVRPHEVQVIPEDAPARGEQSLVGDCSYEAMLRRAGIELPIHAA
jgi:hypothetical protein